MKNLYNSPFEYWEKIGYVGYNNYTDLHISRKQTAIVDQWKASMPAKHDVFLSKNKRVYKKNNLAFLQFIKLFFSFLSKNFFLFRRLCFFFLKWKKKMFSSCKSFLPIVQRHVYSSISRIYNIYLLSLKKYYFYFLKTSRHFFFRYFSIFFSVPGFKKKVFILKKLYVSMCKNLKSTNKHFLLINRIHSIFHKTNLLPNVYFRNFSSKDNFLYTEKGLFKNIPKVLNHTSITFAQYLSNTFNLSIYEIKHYVSSFFLSDWGTFFYFFEYRDQSKYGSFSQISCDFSKFSVFLILLVFSFVYQRIFYRSIPLMYSSFCHLF